MLRLSRFRNAHTIVSKRNWEKVQPLLAKAIAEADFVSFDFELTGLHAKSDRYVGVAQSYDAHCSGVKSFLPIQLGICAAKFHNNTGSWSLTPASIYLYPSSTDEAGTCFSVSTAALNFLGSNGFDFNEWIKDGLGWLSPAEEEERRRLVKARMAEIDQLIREATKAQVGVGDMGGKAVPKLELPEGADKDAMNALKASIDHWLTLETEEPLEVPMESAFVRLLAHTFIGEQFPGLFSHSSKKGDTRILTVYKHKKDLFVDQKRSLELELEKIDRELGARSLFDAVSASRIPLVGHNCFYDLLHTYNSFYGAVPPFVDQFKQKWLAKFPRTFDTKYIAESNDVLGGLQPPATLKALCDFMVDGQKDNPLLVTVDPISDEFNYYLPSDLNAAKATDLSHDAGYDAMMTSLVFLLQMRHILDRKSLRFDQVDFKQNIAGRTGPDETPRIPVHELLRTAVNRIRLVKTQPPSLNLKEREP